MLCTVSYVYSVRYNPRELFFFMFIPPLTHLLLTDINLAFEIIVVLSRVLRSINKQNGIRKGLDQ
jgi:hypothetical protein